MKLPVGTRDIAVTESVRLINEYYQKTAPAVWDLYDNLEPGPRDVILPVDVLAVNALNAFGSTRPMGPMTGLWLLSSAREHAQVALAKVTRQNVEDIDDSRLGAEIEALANVADALQRACHGRGFGQVATAKLLHRLRPGLAAIYDTRVGKHYPQATWQEFYLAVAIDVRSRKAELRAAVDGCVRSSISLLRAWDILIWSTSQSVPAVTTEPARLTS